MFEILLRLQVQQASAVELLYQGGFQNTKKDSVCSNISKNLSKAA